MDHSGSTEWLLETNRLRNILNELKDHDGDRYISDFQLHEGGKISFSCFLLNASLSQAGRIDLVTLITGSDMDLETSPEVERSTHYSITPKSLQSAAQFGITASAVADYLSARMIRKDDNSSEHIFDILRSWKANKTSLRTPTTAPGLLTLTSADGDRAKTRFQTPGSFENPSSDTLESTVAYEVETLGKLENLFKGSAIAVEDKDYWLRRIENVHAKASKSKTVIGVLGATGAGKSSIINAVLDEEQLLPTSCMRSCTAVITEISYNDGSVPYRAEIEFMSAREWESELRILFQDLVDDVSGQILPGAKLAGDTEASVALAKLKAVFPDISRESLSKHTVESLMSHPNVSLLGKTHQLEEADGSRFQTKLQEFVDSRKERPQWTPHTNRKIPSHWPLIRVVRLFLKSAVLSKGVTIVDLPGAHDSNAARGQIAENYMMQCTGIWIVAPITRAVDDKTAKSLLGKTFRRQLRMDGDIDSVTFICSKTDEILVMEASKSFGLYEELKQARDGLREAENAVKDLEGKLRAVKTAIQESQDAAWQAYQEIQTWESHKMKLQGQSDAMSPVKQSQQRRKRNEVNSCESEPSLTAEQLETKIAECKAAENSARNSRNYRKETLDTIESQLKDARATRDTIMDHLHEECIRRRNQFARTEVRCDFANGVREIDQDTAAEADPDNSDPNPNARDYAQVARDLPVFEVSSRAYQKLSGRFRGEPDVPGFSSLDDTQIPQLQDHCRESANASRSKINKAFLAESSQLKISLSIWAEGRKTRPSSEATREERQSQEQYVKVHVSQLEEAFHDLARDVVRSLESKLQENVFRPLDKAIDVGAAQASDIVASWGIPISKGGLHWMTYKANCGRHGDRYKDHEWNAELCEAFLQSIAAGWENAFPKHIARFGPSFVKHIYASLRPFHDSVMKTAPPGTPGISTLATTLSGYEALFISLVDNVQGLISARQKFINRQFKPVVRTGMGESYEHCTYEWGPGCYARIKEYMGYHVDTTGQKMFQDCTDCVKALLLELLKDVRRMIDAELLEILQSVERDYTTVLAGEVPGTLKAEAQREFSEKVLKILADAEQTVGED